jgi:hypothetical protein
MKRGYTVSIWESALLPSPHSGIVVLKTRIRKWAHLQSSVVISYVHVTK